MTMLQTNPGAIAVATTDSPTIEFDASPILREGETVVSAVVRMQTADFRRQVSLSQPPNSTATSVTQLIDGALLTAGTLYRIIWIITLSSGDVVSQQTSAQVPY